MSTSIPIGQPPAGKAGPAEPPRFRERRKRRRRVHPTVRSAIMLGTLAVLMLVAQFVYHNYRTAPRDARAITERELRLSVLQPDERVLQTVSVFRRSPLDYYRATRGVLVLTNKRLVYLGLVPRDLVASPDAPAAFEQREFPVDTLHQVTKGRAIFWTVPALAIKTPTGRVKLAIPSDMRDAADALHAQLATRYAAVRAEGRRQTAARASTEEARRRAEVEAREAKYHQVQRGEALVTIARRYNVTPEYLQQLNGLPNANIRVGQRLMVKPKT